MGFWLDEQERKLALSLSRAPSSKTRSTEFARRCARVLELVWVSLWVWVQVCVSRLFDWSIAGSIDRVVR